MRRAIPFVLSFLLTLGLILLVWLVLPEWLLSSVAERESDEARAVAGHGIGEAILLSFVWTSVAALLLGATWALTPALGRSRELDDEGGRSKLPYWWATLGLVAVAGGAVFWWYRGQIEGVPENWLQTSIFYAFAFASLAVSAYAFQIVTQILSAPHMRPSIPWGVSSQRAALLSRQKGAGPPARPSGGQQDDAAAAKPGQPDGRS